MFSGNLKGVNEVPHSLQSCKDGVLSSEGIFPKEDLKGGLILMLAILKVGIGAGELVKVIEEKVYLVLEVVGHDCYLIIMSDQFSRYISDLFLLNFGEEERKKASIFKLLI